MHLSEKMCMVIKQIGKKSKKKKVNEVYSRLFGILTEGKKSKKNKFTPPANKVPKMP